MKPTKFFAALSLFAVSLHAAAADTLESYASKLKNHTAQHVKYPKRALDRGWEGEVHLRITIDAKGQVQDIQVVEESRYSNLNREALRSVERANPYPPIPAALGLETYEFTMPINFRLSG